MLLYLTPTYFLDAADPRVREFANQVVEGKSDAESRAIALYYAVRDGWRYNPYLLNFRAEALKASTILGTREAHCVGKAILLAACLRAVDIPARLHFYHVTNHLGTSRLEEALQTNVLVFHGATEVWLHDQWITITPAFNAALCEKLGVAPLEFDGKHEAVFQAYDREKGQFMEYSHDYGPFHDLPYEFMLSEFKSFYGDVLINIGKNQDGPLRVEGLDLLQ